MLTFKGFSGINNVLPAERLGNDALTVAKNVDIGLTGEITRRAGYARVSETPHRNLYQGCDITLATINAGDLVNVGSGAVLYPSLGCERVWYLDLPDGRVAFSNELIAGIASASGSTEWGVPIPPSLGAVTEIVGELFDGEYRYQLTYARLSDGAEGGPAYSEPFRLTSGGVFLAGLPVLEGHRINVYLTSRDGMETYLAGTTTTGLFSYTGKNSALVSPCLTDFCEPAPVGRCLAFWRGRTLVAKDNVLYASRSNAWELFDLRRDTKQLLDPITAVVPVDDGVYVGTTKELAFLAGDTWDALAYRRVVDGPVALGSGVPVRGELIKQGEGAGLGSAALFIADGRIVAGFNGGGVVRLTEGRYHTTVTEVFATFRDLGGVPQYVAIPR